MKNFIKIFLFTALVSSSYASDFPIKGELRHRVNFWKKVYTEISTTEAFLHDSENLKLVFKKVNLPPRGKKRNRHLKKIRGEYRNILKNLAKKKIGNFNAREKEVYELVLKAYPNVTDPILRKISKNLRFQYGLRDRYYQGLIRSQKYLVYIKSVLKEKKLPHQLAYLPHVESSFNYQAYSKVGAAGIWQFMRSTARLYKLKVSYTIDERRDVIKATKAAARFLKDNYRQLKTWPLALTAYNHGAASLKRAVKKLGTRDIDQIIARYKGRRFGFASKNFYSTFMATVEISENPERYFPSFKPVKPITFSELTLPKSLNISQIKSVTKLSSKQLKEYNPSIRTSVFRSTISLPRKFKLHVPKTKRAELNEWQSKMASIVKRKPKPGEALVHIISRGESLFDIAKAYSVKLSDLVEDNEIVNPSRVFPGMKINIYQGSKKVALIRKHAPTKPNLVSQTIVKKPAPEAPKTAVNLPSPPVESKNHLNKQLTLSGYELDLESKNSGFQKVTIEVEETLGHFAEWAKVRAVDIRKWNKLSYGRPIFIGQNLLLKISDTAYFEKNRREYHLSLQEDFFESYNVSSEKVYSVKKGDTLSSILNKFELPLWLIRTYQKSKNFNSQLQIGQKIIIPVVLETSTSAKAPFSKLED